MGGKRTSATVSNDRPESIPAARVSPNQAQGQTGAGSDSDCDRKTTHDRQQHRHEEQRTIARAQAHALRPTARLAHQPGRDNQEAGQSRHRKVACQRRGNERDQEDGNRMDDARHRSSSACPDIRGGSRDCPRRRQTSKQRRDDVRNALRQKFRAGSVDCHRSSDRPRLLRARTSTAAKKAITKADGSNSLMRAMLRRGSAGAGRPAGSSPNRDKIVSTGRRSIATKTEAAAITMSEPGNHGARRRSSAIPAIENQRRHPGP